MVEVWQSTLRRAVANQQPSMASKIAIRRSIGG
ncbi:hypothetical protein ACHAWF_008320 [Thalassiosira exigua]